jgi:hypothetical protein
MGALPQALETIFELQRKRSRVKKSVNKHLRVQRAGASRRLLHCSKSSNKVVKLKVAHARALES